MLCSFDHCACRSKKPLPRFAPQRPRRHSRLRADSGSQVWSRGVLKQFQLASASVMSAAIAPETHTSRCRRSNRQERLQLFNRDPGVNVRLPLAREQATYSWFHRGWGAPLRLGRCSLGGLCPGVPARQRQFLHRCQNKDSGTHTGTETHQYTRLYEIAP